MRLLIAVFLASGAVQIVLSIVLAAVVLSSRAAGVPRQVEEGLGIAVVTALAACFPLLAAYGLWCRSRMTRLVLLGISWWSLAGSTVVGAMSVLALAGLIDGHELAFDESPEESLAMAFGISTFNAWQAWVLLRPSVRQSFLAEKHTEPLP